MTMNEARRPHISTRHLQAFLALADERHFTHAAARVHLSQPAFSALIGQLESSLGVRLFDRSTRHVAPTAEGTDFELAARRVLAEFDAALAGVSDRLALRRGRVSVALLPSLAADWLPGVLRDWQAGCPGVQVQVSDVLSDVCVERVRTGQADFALAAVRVDTPELKAEPFCADGFHLVCPAGHPLLGLARVRPRDVAAHPFIHLGRTSSVRQYLDAAVQPLQMRAVMEVDQLATVRGMVAAGMGVSVVPTLTLFQFRHDGVATRPLAWPGLSRRIFFIHRRDRALSLAAQSLADCLRRHPPAHTEDR
ncbi:MAG: LysR family transcriptional regulator [Pseudomonadota bacterium]|nr:LysR family transcriptional regulator [Pseudomonadota bacterium]